ncbi:MAG: hypothetical protein ACRCUS_05700, partial [Anaerovoracaceae bacterium]
MSSNSLQLKRLDDFAKVIISSVDKKKHVNENAVKLCNFTDVYYNWAITSRFLPELMEATAKPIEVEKFEIKKGQVAITKDSETRDDIGVPTYIADDFSDVLLGYHCALITPNEELLDGKFMNAFFHGDIIKKYFSQNASGSGQRY